MKRPNLTVVGAGPVGLVAALVAARRGLSVRALEAESAPNQIRHAMLLHPATLELLAGLGVAESLERAGQRIECLSVHVERERLAAVDFTRSSTHRPYCIAVSQSALRLALLDAVEQEADLRWDHNVTDVIDHADGVEVVTSADRTVSDFVVGADGYGSVVRRATDIDVIDLESTESWALFEGPLDHDLGHEAHIALHDELVSAVWPLPRWKARFSFQLYRGLDVAQDLTTLQALISERMPWLQVRPRSVEWSSVTDFEHLLASRFGAGNVWLAGDAAHSTSPTGAHSLNVGLREASDIARYVSDAVRGMVTRDVFTLYERQRQQEWRRLLGIGLDVRLGPYASRLLRPYVQRLIPCLAASGAELDTVLAQLGIVMVERELAQREAAPMHA